MKNSVPLSVCPGLESVTTFSQACQYTGADNYLSSLALSDDSDSVVAFQPSSHRTMYPARRNGNVKSYGWRARGVSTSEPNRNVVVVDALGNAAQCSPRCFVAVQCHERTGRHMACRGREAGGGPAEARRPMMRRSQDRSVQGKMQAMPVTCTATMLGMDRGHSRT